MQICFVGLHHGFFSVILIFYLKKGKTLATHLYTHTDPVNEKHIQEAARVLEKGGIIAYPTDVNWAVGCDPSQSKALKES